MEDAKRAVASELLIRLDGGDIATEKNTGIIKLCKLVRIHHRRYVYHKRANSMRFCAVARGRGEGTEWGLCCIACAEPFAESLARQRAREPREHRTCIGAVVQHAAARQGVQAGEAKGQPYGQRAGIHVPRRRACRCAPHACITAHAQC